jgi:hypothetical protein
MRKSAYAMNETRGGTIYRLVVRGELDARYTFLFNGMTMEPVAGTTVLTGDVLDQAQLHGFLDRIEELGLELVEIQQMAEPDAPESRPQWR